MKLDVTSAAGDSKHAIAHAPHSKYARSVGGALRKRVTTDAIPADKSAPEMANSCWP